MKINEKIGSKSGINFFRRAFWFSGPVKEPETKDSQAGPKRFFYLF
jgi:hypothetical protein